MDYIWFNRFSALHDGINIIFCKADFLESEFEHIRTLKNDVVLISGNSDAPIDEKNIKNIPKNIVKWFGLNALVNNEIIVPLPLGLENKIESERTGHGRCYFDRVAEKEALLNKNRTNDTMPVKGIYSNFVTKTNFWHRNIVKYISKISRHIDWDNPNLTLNQFFEKIMEYKMVVCPAGNGIDTHRLWEVLYSNRIPITIKMGNYKIYELYNKFPIIILNNTKDLFNERLIYQKYDEITSKYFDTELLDFNYWFKEIEKYGKSK